MEEEEEREGEGLYVLGLAGCCCCGAHKDSGKTPQPPEKKHSSNSGLVVATPHSDARKQPTITQEQRGGGLRVRAKEAAAAGNICSSSCHPYNQA